MEVKEISLTEKAMKRRDYRQLYAIKINGKTSFTVSDGEPEDSNLSRDFNDCYNIPILMKAAYYAGKAGEEFILSFEEVDEY